MDWFSVLAPLLLLPIAFLFVFVGCSLQDFGTAYLNVTLVWKPPLGADVAKLQAVASGYILAHYKAVQNPDTGTDPNPNDGQNLRQLNLTLSEDTDDEGDLPNDFETIVCSLQVSLFDAQGKELLRSDGKPKVPYHEKSGTLSADGDQWCFQLNFTASSDEYSISDIACP